MTVRAALGFGSARRALALSSAGDSGYSIGANLAGESYVERAIERGLAYATRAKTLAPNGTPVVQLADAIIVELEEARTLRQSLLDGDTEGVESPERCGQSRPQPALLARRGRQHLPPARQTAPRSIPATRIRRSALGARQLSALRTKRLLPSAVPRLLLLTRHSSSSAPRAASQRGDELPPHGRHQPHGDAHRRASRGPEGVRRSVGGAQGTLSSFLRPSFPSFSRRSMPCRAAVKPRIPFLTIRRQRNLCIGETNRAGASPSCHLKLPDGGA